MKKSYIRLICYISFFGLLTFLNSFVYGFLSQITLDILLAVMLTTAYMLFGFEKDRHRYMKDIILEIIILLISFFLIYYLFGIIIGFAKVGNYYTINSMVNIIFPIIFYILLGEILRYQLLVKSSESKYLIYLVCILFILLDSTIGFSTHDLGNSKEAFLFFSTVILPSISKNILCSFLCLNFGFKTSIVYRLVMELYSYLFYIVPDPNNYLYSVIFFLFPFYILFRIKRWLNKDKVNNIVEVRGESRKLHLLSFLPLGIITFILVYFISGYFRFYAVAIASGSMEPNISKGDVVIVDKDDDDLSVGKVLAYYYGDKVVVHRIYKIIDANGEYYIYTKGDANNNYDNYKIDRSMVIGIVKFKVPAIGYPTVLLNEYW